MAFLSSIKPKCSRWLLIPIYIEENINTIEEKLNITSNFQKENISEQTFEKAAKIFTYLSFCPPKLMHFFDNLFKTNSPRDIFLALTNVQGNSLAEKESFGKIFLKTLEILKLEHYRSIDKITQKMEEVNFTDTFGKIYYF